MHKRLAIASIFFLLVIPNTCFSTGEMVVISRFQISSENGSNDEYVDLYNPSATKTDISGWKLAKKSASLSASPVYLRTSFPEGTVIEPRSHLVVAHPDCACASGMLYASNTGSVPSGIASDNTIILFDKVKTIIDKVGFGKAGDYEGAPLEKSPADGEVYARRNNADSENNRADFYLAYSPPVEQEKTAKDDPSAEVSYPEATAGADIRVSEFMINPEGSDAEGEWIEIYNGGQSANISGYAIADRLGSPKKYIFPKGTQIKSHQYLAFYSGKTPISLNNDGDAVEVLSPTGEVINYSKESGKGKEGNSYALGPAGWAWTSKPTPGRGNIIEAPAESESKEGNGQVLSLVDGNILSSGLPAEETAVTESNDRYMGYGLIALAFIVGISYTLYSKKEKIVEIYHKIRKRDSGFGKRFRWRFKRR